MRRLSAAAERVSHNIDARTQLPEYAGRTDEVAQMATAFHAMTSALCRRIEASEKFAADVAHELKNPLTAARSTAESLGYAKTEEERTHLVQQIQGELKRLNRLITDVSNASRLDAELARKEMRTIDVTAMLRNVVSIFRDIIGDDSRALMLAIGSEPFPGAFSVNGDEGRLGQVLTNLIDNAISFSPEGGTVTAQARVAGAVRRDRRRGRRARHPRRSPGDHLRSLLFGSPGDRHQPRQELRPRPQHLARDRSGARRPDHRREPLRSGAQSPMPSRAARDSSCACRLPASRSAEERPVGDAADTHHGTAIAIGGSAALIIGPSGAGKSDLALRCLAIAPTTLIPVPAHLIADDRVLISLRTEGACWSRRRKPSAASSRCAEWASSRCPTHVSADLALIVELVAPEAVERLPDPPPRARPSGRQPAPVALGPVRGGGPREAAPGPCAGGSNAGQTLGNMTPQSSCARAEHL